MLKSAKMTNFPLQWALNSNTLSANSTHKMVKHTQAIRRLLRQIRHFVV